MLGVYSRTASLLGGQCAMGGLGLMTRSFGEHHVIEHVPYGMVCIDVSAYIVDGSAGSRRPAKMCQDQSAIYILIVLPVCLV